jgi:hypothetical protein
MNYLIFLNRLESIDDLEARRAKARAEKHASIFDAESEQCRFSYWKNLPAEEMLAHVQTVVFPWLKSLAPENHAFTSFMKDAAFLIPKASLLVEAVNVIDELRITDRNLDTQGDIYEYMLGKLGVAGQIGQFRTPRHIIRAIVQMVDPKMGEVIMDPACGTGGFLMAAYQHIVAKATSDEFLGYDEEAESTSSRVSSICPLSPTGVTASEPNTASEPAGWLPSALAGWTVLSPVARGTLNGAAFWISWFSQAAARGRSAVISMVTAVRYPGGTSSEAVVVVWGANVTTSSDHRLNRRSRSVASSTSLDSPCSHPWTMARSRTREGPWSTAIDYLRSVLRRGIGAQLPTIIPF